MNTDIIARAVPLIVEWYKENERSLPWRERPVDPYRVWISEIMLQQTRIEAVIPYYHRFLSSLPDVLSLSLADDDRLMKLWEGLGYYSRARNLKKAAEYVVKHYGGRLPSTVEELKKLPGIGAYTAGAIASIAFGQPSPAVDGNVLRVISRLIASDMDIAAEKSKRTVESALIPLYPAGADAGNLTQGLMELGEVLCIPNGAPNCALCPLNGICLAHLQQNTDKFPVKSAKKERKIQKRTVLILEHDGRFALRKRKPSGLLASMIEFPALEEGEELQSFLAENNLEGTIVKECGSAVHVFTHVEWHMFGLWIHCKSKSDSFQWYTAEQIRSELAIPTAFRYFRKLLS